MAAGQRKPDLAPVSSGPRDALKRAIPVTTRLLMDVQFKEHLEALASFLIRSIELRDNAARLLDLQAEMVAFLIGFQDSQKELQMELGEERGADRARSYSPGTVIEVCRRIQRLVRQIGDGIAWRALNYDRTRLRLLAQKPHTGHIELASMKEELIQAADHLGTTGDVVVLNDLTNYLRYGDYTAVGAEGVSINEVKGGKGSRRSGKAVKQRQKTKKIIDFLEHGVAETEEGPKKIVYLNTEPRDHLAEVRELIRKARKDGFGYARVSDCTAAAVVDITYMSDKMAGGAKVTDFFRNPFEQSKHADMWDNLSLSDHFTWNVAPYSVFPFPPEDRLAIMTGEYWLLTFFNFGNLVKCLRRRNFYVREPQKDWYESVKNLPGWEVAARELENPLVVSLGPPHPVLSIPMSALARLFYETLDEECFADRIEEELSLFSGPNREPSGPIFLHTGFRSEGELWD